MPEKKVALNLRLPPDLHEMLRKAADDEDRSLSNLIVHVLREWSANRVRDRDDRQPRGR